MYRRMNRLSFWLPSSLLLLLATCAHAPEVAPPCEEYAALPVTLRASERLNPNPQGHPLPTVVRLIQVKSAAKAEMSDLDELWDHEKEVLAEDFVSLTELTLNPGETNMTQLVPAKEARQLIVVGLFQQPTGNAWRVMKSLPPVADRPCANPKPKGDGNEDRKASKKTRGDNEGTPGASRLRFSFENVTIEEIP